MNKILSTAQALYILSSSFILASTLPEEEARLDAIIVPHITCSDIALAPESLTAEQIKELRNTGRTSYGSYTLSTHNQKAFESNMPSFWRIVSGTYSGLAARLKLNPHAQLIAPLEDKGLQLVANYSCPDTYGGMIEFDIAMDVPVISNPTLFHPEDKLGYLNLLDSPLGEKDFFNAPGTPPYARKFSFAQLTAYFDGSFVTQTRHAHRLNQNVKSLLLIIAQQEGQDIYNLALSERDNSADILYKSYLIGKNITPLKSDNELLDTQDYQNILKELVERIFNNSGYSTLNCPIDLAINEELMKRNLDLTAQDLSLLVLLKRVSLENKAVEK
jgi:hypothetical protein